MTHSVLVINCGSSSIKFALYDQANVQQPTLKALAEKLGSNTPEIHLSGTTQPSIKLPAEAGHKEALGCFIEQAQPWLNNLAGIGHRVVHGGEVFSDSTLLTTESIEQLDAISHLAPLHNPVNMLGIRLCRELLPNTPNVAVFDTAFHQTLNEDAFLYGLPYQWYQQHAVRRYGFHGTSYRYITQETARRLKKPANDLNLLVAHLGNGCSACAIAQGQSFDTSMGMTPLEGLMMGSRSGDIDPGLIAYMVQQQGMTLDNVMTMLNRDSGLKGLSQLSNDMRTLLAAEQEGHTGAKRAIDVFCFRAARQLAGLSASLTNIDALVFTGGIGEHSAIIRQRTLSAWRSAHYQLEDSLNQQHGDETGRISQLESPLVMVVPTDEEGMIAQDTLRLINEELPK